jgi:hypothetical protein
MDEDWETIWTFHTAQFTVDFAVTDELDLDLPWDDDGSVRDALERGLYVALVLRAQVSKNDCVIGSFSVHNCVYERSALQFRKRKLMVPDMVYEAIADARKALAR